LKLIQAQEHDAVDNFWEDYQNSKDLDFSIKAISKYIKGWWCDILEDGLRSQKVEDTVI
jgi:hypothetical protein